MHTENSYQKSAAIVCKSEVMNIYIQAMIAPIYKINIMFSMFASNFMVNLHPICTKKITNNAVPRKATHGPVSHGHCAMKLLGNTIPEEQEIAHLVTGRQDRSDDAE